MGDVLLCVGYLESLAIQLVINAGNSIFLTIFVVIDTINPISMIPQ